MSEEALWLALDARSICQYRSPSRGLRHGRPDGREAQRRLPTTEETYSLRDFFCFLTATLVKHRGGAPPTRR